MYDFDYYYDRREVLNEDDLPGLIKVINYMILGSRIIEMKDYINSVRPWYRSRVDDKYAYKFINKKDLINNEITI